MTINETELRATIANLGRNLAAKDAQIAELTACVAAHQRSLVDHAKMRDANLVEVIPGAVVGASAIAGAAPELNEPTAELVQRLTEYATNPGYSHNDYADTMKQAVSCIGQLVYCVEFYQNRYAESTARKRAAPVAAFQQECAAATRALAATPAQPIAPAADVSAPEAWIVKMHDGRRIGTVFSEQEAKDTAATYGNASTITPLYARSVADVSAPTDERPSLPDADTTWYAPFGGAHIKYHSTDQIYAFADARVRAARAAAPVSGPTYEELAADLKTARATIRVMDKNKAEYLARNAELESAAPVSGPSDGPEFTVDDPDLDALLNLAADMAKGIGNMDSGMLFLSILGKVESRLMPISAAPVSGQGASIDTPKFQALLPDDLSRFRRDEIVAYLQALLQRAARPAPVGAVPAPACNDCRDTGQVCTGTSGQESDGNAPTMECCPSCGYGAAAPVAPAQAVTDEQIIGVLHSQGIDTKLSDYGFEALQVSGNNVPGIRALLTKFLDAMASGDWPEPMYDFDGDGKVVYRPAILAKRSGRTA